jgi:hypothetical protein
MTKNRTPPQETPPAPPTLAIDWDLYGQYLDASDLSDADKRAFIETLWSIVVSFVDLGFGLHPTQQTCGQADRDGIADLRDVISLGTPTDQTTETAASTRSTARDAQKGAR